MNITKLFLLGAVGSAGLAFTPMAQADDHHHHGDRDRHHHHYDDGRGYRPYYYSSQPEVIYTNPDYGYYRGSNDVTIAIGGHRSYRYHAYHR
ncbi:MAG: hypothetical protein P4L99_09140 [Chthoniobacter sp.]|nr:hypothetical protein [Chthoniobacter sp.]